MPQTRHHSLLDHISHFRQSNGKIMLLRNFEGRFFSAYSSLVILISRKMTQDKRVVTDFRHINMCIAKNYLAYLLLKDTFTLLGSSRCKVLSVLDLKDAFYLLRLTENSKKFCGILPYLVVHRTCIKGCLCV